MSRKHNTKHARKRSNYPRRLDKRGVTSRTVHMRDLDTLRTAAAQLDNPEHDTWAPHLVTYREHMARVQLSKPLYEGRRPYAIHLPGE